MNSGTMILAQGLRTVREETHVELVRWSSGNALLAGGLLTAVGLYVVWWLYRREGRGRMSRGMRWALLTCRMLLLLTLGMIGLEPVLARYVHRRLDARTIVLVDRSASMSLPDQYHDTPDATRVERVLGERPAAGARRTELAAQVLDKSDGGLLNGLAQRNPVQLFDFARNVVPAAMVSNGSSGHSSAASQRAEKGEGDERAADRLDGSGTDLATAVRTAIDSAGGAPIAGLVLLSDGGFNLGEDPAVVAEFLKRLSIPVCVVGVGDPTDPVNIRIADVTTPRSAFKNDPIRISVRIEGRNTEGRSVTLELLERDAGKSGQPEVVESRNIAPDSAGRYPTTAFERRIEKPGTYTYIARVRPLENEVVTSDNQREAIPPVHVLDDMMRVLLVAGGPSYDYRFLARMLERDKTVNLSTWLQSADVNAVRDGNTVITELPSQPEDLFKYDAIILMDCQPDEFGPTWGSLVAAFVADHGGGVLLAAGPKYTPKFMRSPNSSSIVELLPVVPDPDAEIILNDLGHFQTRVWPLVVPEEAAGDPILRLADDEAANKAIWATLEGVYWHYPVLRPKPVAAALLRHSNPRMANAFGPHVLIATQYVGTGRSAFLGIDTTWRWRGGDERVFNRFWTQLLRFLVEGKLSGGRQRATISTEREQYDAGDSIVVTVRALDTKFEPLEAPQLDMQVSRLNVAHAPDESDAPPPESVLPAPSAQIIALRPISGRDGFYQGRFVPSRTGTYQLGLRLPGASDDDASASAAREIIVSEPDIEMRQPAMQRAVLKQFADRSGGAYFDIDEADQIAQRIEDRSRTFVLRERPRPLWDNGYVLALLVGLVSTEWILRKVARLL